MGFETLGTAIVDNPVILTEDLVAFNDEALDDASALAIVKGDVDSSISYVQSKGLPTDWDMCDELYRAYVKPRTWPGTDVARANLSMHLILETLEKLMPEIYLSFFSEDQPFLIEPKGRTTPEAARARGKVLNWALKNCDFKEQMRITMKQCLQYGYCIGKHGWETEDRVVKTYSRKEQPKKIPAGNQQITLNTEASDEVRSE